MGWIVGTAIKTLKQKFLFSFSDERSLFGITHSIAQHISILSRHLLLIKNFNHSIWSSRFGQPMFNEYLAQYQAQFMPGNFLFKQSN
ncbi:hypothetical protein [Nitrosospira sp. Nsp1]|uniref:hypothetical protein n=1 Tax=Nitrosospira sp. Nsp1 TaxID=136547 RepID=UPI0008891F18|nr:hypothetical protein [Nitrosospira sp. Nsp1]SCX48781.1 hypothetical protein SAMN05720354_10830 [Nitrosospira sp. Nsp1]